MFATQCHLLPGQCFETKNCIFTKEQDTFMRRLSEFSVLFQILAYFLVSKEQPGIMFVLSSGPRHRTGKGNSLYFI